MTLLCAAVVLSGAAISDCEARTFQRIVVSGATVLAFGDSLTYGIGGSGTDYPSQLAEQLGISVINAGSPGDTAETGAERFVASVERAKPSLILLCLGINDFYRKVSHADTRRSLAQMLDHAGSLDIPVLLIGVPPPGATAAHPMYRELATKFGVALDDKSLVATLRNPAYKADPVHLNAAGYTALAERIAGRLRALERDP